MFDKIFLMRSIDRGTYLILFLLTGLVYVLGLFFPLMDPDANEYAAIAMRMAQRNDFINIISRNTSTLQEFDYLDKPHLLFWLSALSFKIFGVSDWAYRLPSVLFSVWGTYATFRLGSLLYNREVGKMAALLFATALAIILFNHDVRTDTILTATVIFAVWQLAAFVQTEKLLHIVLGAAGVALGVATKGMIAVLVAGTATFCYIAHLRKWKLLLSWKWLPGLLAFGLTLSPVLHCYYLQFDRHPEKWVNGGYRRSGIRFLLWTQSFERLSGQRMQSSPEFSFFYHTLLWAILPWSILVYVAVFGRIKRFWQLGLRPVKEIELLTLGTVLIIFHLMSASKFKLPHYLNILFPLFAILLASYLYNLAQRGKLKQLKQLRQIQYFIITVMLLLALLVNVWAFPVRSFWVLLGAAAFVVVLAYALRTFRVGLPAIVVPSAVAVLLLGFLMNASFYPQLMQYQSGNQLASWAKKTQVAPADIYLYRRMSYSMDFYLQQTTPALSDSLLRAKAATGLAFYVVVFDEDLPAIEATGVKTSRAHRFYHTNVSRLDGRFLNPAKRGERLTGIDIVRVN